MEHDEDSILCPACGSCRVSLMSEMGAACSECGLGWGDVEGERVCRKHYEPAAHEPAPPTGKGRRAPHPVAGIRPLGYTIYHPMKCQTRYEDGKIYLDVEQAVEVHFGEPPSGHGRVK